MILVIDNNDDARLVSSLGFAHAQHRGNNVWRVSNVGTPTTREVKKTVTRSWTRTRDIDAVVTAATKVRTLTRGVPATSWQPTKERTIDVWKFINRTVTNEYLASIPLTHEIFAKTQSRERTVTKYVSKSHTVTSWVTRWVTTSQDAATGIFRLQITFSGGDASNHFDLWGTDNVGPRTPVGTAVAGIGYKSDGSTYNGGPNDYYEFGVQWVGNVSYWGPKGTTPKKNVPNDTTMFSQEFWKGTTGRFTKAQIRAYNAAGAVTASKCGLYKIPGASAFGNGAYAGYLVNESDAGATINSSTTYDFDFS